MMMVDGGDTGDVFDVLDSFNAVESENKRMIDQLTLSKGYLQRRMKETAVLDQRLKEAREAVEVRKSRVDDIIVDRGINETRQKVRGARDRSSRVMRLILIFSSWPTSLFPVSEVAFSRS